MSINFDELPENIQKLFKATFADNLEKQGKSPPTDKERHGRIEDLKADKLYKEDDLL